MTQLRMRTTSAVLGVVALSSAAIIAPASATPIANASDMVGDSDSTSPAAAASQTVRTTAAEVSPRTRLDLRRPAGRIAYHAYVNRLPVIFTIRPDGSLTRQLTHNDTYNNAPAWSPGGLRIVYGRTGPTGNHLVIMKRDGTDKHQITHGQYEIYPAWSPSGGRIAYACLFGNDFEICTVRANGTHRRVLTDSDAYDNHVDWSPTGKLIAFSSDRDGDSDIYTMRPDGTHVRQITHNTTGDDNPSFSPSGRRIAYDGESRGGDTEIFIRNTTGHGARIAVTHNAFFNAQAAWSPAGGRIAYIEDNGTGADIYTNKVDGGDRHRVTRTRIDEDVPEWGPRPGR